MKFSVLQADLNKAVGIVGKAISIRASLPILSNILIASDKGRLKLSATDLDKSITTWIGAKIDKEGAVTVPAKILADFVSNLPSVKVTGAVENNILTLNSQNASASFNGIDASEFPISQNLSKGEYTVKIDSALLTSALSDVVFAAATDESRPILTGVLIQMEDKKLTFVSVDGFRLSERTLEIKDKIKEPKNVVVPARTLMEISRIALSAKSHISLSFLESENLIIFESEDLLASTRILEGAFPDYKKIIPAEEGNLKVTISHEEFLSAVKIANVFARDSSNVVKLLINPKDGVYVSSEAYEVGQNKTLVEAKVEGEETEIIFDGRFLGDFLTNVKCEDLEIEMQGALTPAVFKPKGRKDYIHIIMPRRP